MKALGRRAAIGALLALAATPALAQSAFCAGWKDGWEAAYRNRNMLVAMVPMCPMPQLGQSSYQHGYEAGMLAALRNMR